MRYTPDTHRPEVAMSPKYAAVMEQTDAGGFGVWFPDFPGCIAHAEDALTAAQGAHKALARRLEMMAESGEAIPQPTPAEAVELPDVPSYVFLVEADAPAARVAHIGNPG